MKSTSSRKFFLLWPNCAKLSIARLFTAFLLFSGSVASADFTSSDSATLQNLDTTTATISAQLSTVNQALASQNVYWQTDQVLQGNIVTILRSITNSIAHGGFGKDVLAGNPWWATNSYFVATYNLQNPVMLATGASPNLSDTTKFSFPELMSFWSGQLNTPTLRGVPLLGTRSQAEASFASDEWRSMWGTGRLPTTANRGNYNFTWFDWMAELQKMRYDAVISNRVLETSPSLNALLNEAHDYGVDQPTEPAATALPEYELPADPGLPEAEDALHDADEAIGDFIDDLPKPRTGGSSEIVVIPEFTIGGIHVREYRANLATSIVPLCRSVCSFLYAVSLCAFLFSFAKAEYAYYASVGRHWGRYH